MPPRRHKAAVASLRSLALELGERRIQVNCRSDLFDPVSG
jgi:hypothetical protein